MPFALKCDLSARGLESTFIPAKPPVFEMMHHFDGAVGLGGLQSLPASGGIYGDQTLFKGLLNHKAAGPEIPLNEDVIPGRCRFRQPFPNRSEIIGNGRKIGRYLPPDVPDMCRGPDNPVHPQRCQGIDLLRFGKGVVEDQEEGAGHGLRKYVCIVQNKQGFLKA